MWEAFNMKSLKIGFIFLLFFIISACNFSLAQDIKPPTDIPKPVNQIASLDSQTSEFPQVPPIPSNGKIIYEEKCAPCHGADGLGKGNLSDQFIEPLPAIGLAEVARLVKPIDWFQVVTQGRMDKQMPPFSSLSDQERWDVVAYVYSLSTSMDQVAHGQELYATNCVNCHGENGKGDGAQASLLEKTPTDLSSQEWISKISSFEISQSIKNGVGNSMPALGNQLNESDIWSIIDYLRFVTFQAPSSVAQEDIQNNASASTTPLPELNLTTELTKTTPTQSIQISGLISGTITNLSTGEIPVGLDVLVHGFDEMQIAYTQTVKTDDSGIFNLSEVPFAPGRSFMATVEHSGITFGSDIETTEEGKSAISLPISIYETTNDPSALSIERLHLFIEPVNENVLRVVELIILSNSGNDAVIPKSDTEPTFTIPLPTGATNLQFQDGQLGERYIETPGGFADLSAIRPGVGTSQILLGFELPFQKKLGFIQQMKLKTDAVVVMVPESSLQIKGNYQDVGVREAEGFTFRTYNGTGLSAEEELRLTINKVSSNSNPLFSKSNSGQLFFGIASLSIVLGITGVWLFLRNRKTHKVEVQEQTSTYDSPEMVMDAILALDDLYKAGQLPEEAYQQRRQNLKAQLKTLLDNK
jgi:mono/diheme cytochrome c family protein